MRAEDLKRTLCSSFCGGVNVTPVPSGYAISSLFEDNSGDRISFYLSPGPDGYVIEDDGSYLSHLVAKDIPIDQGQRGQLLDAILSQAQAFWDRETFEIRTSSFPEDEAPRRIMDFLSSMIRVRDLELITREVVRSTFREDAISAITVAFGALAKFNEDEPVNKDFREFPADLIIHPHGLGAKSGALYFVNANDKLNEALLLQMEAQRLNRDDFKVVALLEEPEMRTISRKKFQRAQNRLLTMPIFRGDEDAAMNVIGHSLGLPVKAAA